jgi:hypothetical protein
MTVEEALISAINSKVSLAVDYDHHIRLISPIRFGWKTTDEKGLHKNLFCYQFAGYSTRPSRLEGSEANYRCWNADMIYSALPIKDPWRPAAGWFKRKSHCIDEVIAGAPV